MNSPRAIAFSLAGVALFLNLIAENLLLALRPTEGILIPGLLSLRYAWNHGVSFSLLWQDSETGSRILIGLLLILSVIVAVFAWRARSTLLACGLGLVLGGALGNLLDRLLYGALLDRQLYGAVLDFLAVHLGDAPLFVCNLSDIFISAGAALLMAAELRSLPRRNQT